MKQATTGLLIVSLALIVFNGTTWKAEAEASSAADTAPGRTLAQQAMKAQERWNTTDHSKHEALKDEFRSGTDITKAC
ncbi:MAG: cytochrome C, partial [Desulfobacterales bacterium]